MFWHKAEVATEKQTQAIVVPPQNVALGKPPTYDYLETIVRT